MGTHNVYVDKLKKVHPLAKDYHSAVLLPGHPRDSSASLLGRWGGEEHGYTDAGPSHICCANGSPKWCAESSPDQTQCSWVPCASEPLGTSPMSQSRVSHRTGPWWAGQPLSSFPKPMVVPLFWVGRTVLVQSLHTLSPDWLQDVKARRWGRLWRCAPPSGKLSNIMMAVSGNVFFRWRMRRKPPRRFEPRAELGFSLEFMSPIPY